jgi:dTDP-glucose 4,6-dehydratase
MTVRALAGEQLPLYGTGMQIRDWIFVDDHADAILAAFDRGRVGGRYAIASGCERSNIDVVNAICREVDRLVPESPNCPHARLVTFVADRPGHDARYALDAKRTRSELGWLPQTPFEDGLAKSVAWYVTNAAWWRPLLVERYSGERLGLSGVT